LGNLSLLGAVSGSGAFLIDNGNVLEFGSSVAGGTVEFGGSSGTLKIDAPASFNAEIGMAQADPAEVIDLGGFNSHVGDTFTTSTSLNAGVTTLTVTDLSRGTSESVNIIGDFTGATWNITADGSGGADVSDPPAATASSHPVRVAFGLNLAGDQIDLSSNQIWTHSGVNQPTPVSLGRPDNDNFTFLPGIGADTIANFNPQNEKIEFDHFANMQTVQHLAWLSTPEPLGGVVGFDHCNGDAPCGTSAAYLHAHLSSLTHLL
jgi:hypothetical protein